ncbi:60S acidic ribosomal protein P2 [Thelohanellus kitauei]|uniref:Large ribosomal subunit protein P2 n=1 Tax=Thelohanellus kitauei TaxID=669202 RepID=A0A0C2M0P3_THEKT|nr:60S acidic ribosomal protein P2 [Thelohanellus kitauei]
MRYLAAYVLAKLGGLEDPNLKDIKEIFEAAEGEFDQKQAELVISRLKGKDIDDLIQKGKLKISSLAPAAAVSAAPAQAVKEAAAPAAQKKPEPESESSDEGGGLGDLFD